MRYIVLASPILLLMACENPQRSASSDVPDPDFVLSNEQTHNKFNRSIPPAIRVPSGSVIEAHTHEATGGQLSIDSTVEDLVHVDMNRVHTLTGPIYVEGAEAGDVLSVELLEFAPGDWGWTAIGPHFGFLADETRQTILKTFRLDKANNRVEFADGISIPLRPFAGVMGVAPDTEEMLVTL